MGGDVGLKRLIVIRHAHRFKNAAREEDNGLSPKGRRQAARVTKFFKKRYGRKSSPVVLSSPKARCMETVHAIARAGRGGIERSALLDEGSRVEARAREFLTLWQEGRLGGDLTVICSHGDWIPVFLGIATGVRTELSKGAWAEMEWEGAGQPMLTWLVQEF